MKSLQRTNKKNNMKYFLDTEFIEGFKKPIKWLPTIGNFNKPYHSIQLVSIGIVAEDGREYYAISNEFDPRDADAWVRDNVLLPIYQECVVGDMRNHFPFSTRMNSGVTRGKGKSNKQIAEEIYNFCNVYHPVNLKTDDPEFYAYFADYDWVVFCSLFGTMMDLPKGFPMYCNDLKQSLDEKEKSLLNEDGKVELVSEIIPEYGCAIVAVFDSIKEFGAYPIKENEHNALADARWNKKLYEFLKKL